MSLVQEFFISVGWSTGAFLHSSSYIAWTNANRLPKGVEVKNKIIIITTNTLKN